MNYVNENNDTCLFTFIYFVLNFMYLINIVIKYPSKDGRIQIDSY